MAFEAVADTLHFGGRPSASASPSRPSASSSAGWRISSVSRSSSAPATGSRSRPPARRCCPTRARRSPPCSGSALAPPSWPRDRGDVADRHHVGDGWPARGSAAPLRARRVRRSSWTCGCSRPRRSSPSSPRARSTWRSCARRRREPRAWRRASPGASATSRSCRRPSGGSFRAARGRRAGGAADDGHPTVSSPGHARRAAGRVPVDRGAAAGASNDAHTAGDAGHDRDRRRLDVVHRRPRPWRCARCGSVRAAGARTAESRVAPLETEPAHVLEFVELATRGATP